jgi:biopolymer transport protein ExbB/TolQ
LKYKNPNKYMKISNKIDELKDFVVPKMAAIEEYKEKTTVDVARNMRDIAQTNDRLNAELKKMAVEAIEQKKREEYLRRQNDSLLAKQELMEADMKSFKEMLAKIISNAPALTNSS